MFWPAFGWHGSELGCICPVSGWCEAVPDAIWLVSQRVDGNRLFFSDGAMQGPGALRACLLGMGRLSMLQLASRLDFHFLSGWHDESFEDQTH